MGCCLTKKSRVRNKGLNETLLDGEGDIDHYNSSGSKRNGYAAVQMPSDDGRKFREDSVGVGLVSQRSYDGPVVNIAGLEHLKQVNKEKTRKVVGTSLLVLPAIKTLKRAGWVSKRGHLVLEQLPHFYAVHFICSHAYLACMYDDFMNYRDATGRIALWF